MPVPSGILHLARAPPDASSSALTGDIHPDRQIVCDKMFAFLLHWRCNIMNKHNETIDRQLWPQLEDENWVELLAYLGTSPLAESSFADDLTWVVTGVHDNTYNGVLRTRLADTDVDRAIAEMPELFRARKVPHLWYISSGDLPADLAQRLEAHGCKQLDAGVGMAADLLTLNEQIRSVPGLLVERVRDEAGLASWFDAHPYFSDDESVEVRQRLYLSLGLVGDLPLRFYVAKIGDQAVGGFGLFFGERAAGIYDVSVLPHMQRQGIGTAMALAALQEARKIGYRVAVLGPTPGSIKMYERLGFVLHRSTQVSYYLPLEE
jgi:GNAT superfamily N-acetyltransferase